LARTQAPALARTGALVLARTRGPEPAPTLAVGMASERACMPCAKIALHSSVVLNYYCTVARTT
ncbi:hypothetical protein BAE44_0006909, partial [Dichanthelium oligosanthes]